MYTQKETISVAPRVLSQSDYFPWQRTSRASGGSRQSAGSSSPSVKSDDYARQISIEPNRTACSSVCRHSWNKRSTTGGNVAVSINKKKQKLLALLKVQVKAKENSLLEYKKHYGQLLKENLNMKEEITKSEGQTFGEATALLQCYRQYRGSIGTLNKQYSNQLTIARADFNKTKGKVLNDVHEIQVRVDDVNRRLLAKNNDVTTLLNYKDKEYSGKALYISKLKRKRDKLIVLQKDELEELYNTMQADRQKRVENEEHCHEEMRYEVNEEAVHSLNTNIKEIALQNMIMKKEIQIHENEILELEDFNTKLENEIREYLRDKSLNPAEQLFPDIFQLKKRCQPHDHIPLDIPLRKWLPL